MNFQTLIFAIFISSVLLSCSCYGSGGSSHHPAGNGPESGGVVDDPGGCGGNNSGKLTVIISFDSLSPASQRFFTNQLKPTYDDFSKCVQWHFIPYSTSRIVDDVLKCIHGIAECQIDVLHACASHYYEKDEYKLGKFFICMMTAEQMYVSGEDCAKEAGLDWKLLCACEPSKDAGTWCDNRHKQLNILHEDGVPGVIYNWKHNPQADNESCCDLKLGLCNELKRNNMHCPACGNSGGGHQGHGGGIDGGTAQHGQSGQPDVQLANQQSAAQGLSMAPGCSPGESPGYNPSPSPSPPPMNPAPAPPSDPDPDPLPPPTHHPPGHPH